MPHSNCPGCASPLSEGAEACSDCGYVLKTADLCTLSEEVRSICADSKSCGAASPPDECRCLRCGAFISAMLLQGRYRIDKLLKKGGFGAVYSGVDTGQGDRQVVIKDMMIDDPKHLPLYLKFFRREAEILRALQTVRIAPRLYDFILQTQAAQLIIEFIPGQNLRDVMEVEANKPFPLPLVIGWGIAACELLEVMHGQNPPLIYRDLKPDNIMLLEDQRSIRIIDFGAARELGQSAEEQARKDTGLFSEGYTPPEQMAGKTELRSDLYALAATLYHLATGKEPEALEAGEAVQRLLDDRLTPLPVEDRWFYELLRINLSHSPGDRYASATQVKLDLEGQWVTFQGAVTTATASGAEPMGFSAPPFICAAAVAESGPAPAAVGAAPPSAAGCSEDLRADGPMESISETAPPSAAQETRPVEFREPIARQEIESTPKMGILVLSKRDRVNPRQAVMEAGAPTRGPVRTRPLDHGARPIRKRRVPALATAFVLTFIVGALGLGWLWWQSHILPYELRFLPEPCHLIAVVDADSLRRSQVFQYWKEQGQFGEKEEREWARRYGLRWNAVSKIFVSGDFSAPTRFCLLFLMNEPVDAAQVLQLIETGATQPKRIGRFEVYGAPLHSFCLLDEHAILLGETTYLEEVLEHPRTHKSPGSIFCDFLRERDPTETVSLLLDSSVMAQGPMFLDRIDLGPPLGTLRQSISWLKVEGKWSSRAKLTLSLAGRSAQDRSSLGALLKALSPSPLKAQLPGSLLNGDNWTLSGKQASIRIDLHPRVVLMPLLQMGWPAAYWSRTLQEKDHPRQREALKELLRRKQDAVGYLVAGLRAENIFARRKCADALGQIGLGGRDVASSLLEHTRSTDSELRAIACEAACRLDAKSPNVHLAVLEALSQPDPHIKQIASAWLPKFPPLGKNEIGELCKLFETRSRESAPIIVRDLGSIGARCRAEGTLPELLLDTLLRALDGGPDLRLAAQQALGNLRPLTLADWPVVRAALESQKRSFAKRFILSALAEDRLEPPMAFAVVASVLKNDPEWPVRVQAVQAMLHLRASPDDRLKAWTEALHDSHPEVRLAVLGALAALGDQARETVPSLIELAENGDTEVRLGAIDTLGKIGPPARLARRVLRLDAGRLLLELAEHAEVAIPVFEEALQDPDRGIRRVAAGFLRRTAPRAFRARSPLVLALDDTDGLVRILAMQALEKMEPKPSSAVLPISRLLKDPDKEIRLQALASLEAFGSLASPVVPTLVAATRDADPFVRGRSFKALARFGKENSAARDALIEAMKDDDAANRNEAAATVQGLKELAAPGLEKLLKEPRSDVRLLALRTLGVIGEGAAPCADSIIKAVQNEEKIELRLEAIKTLGKVGSGRKAAIAALEGQLESDDKTIRREAVGSLARFGAAGKPATDAVVRMLRSEEKDGYTAAAAALRAFRLDKRDYVRQLIGAFRNKDIMVRLQIIQDIKKVGKPAFLPLQQGLDHPQAVIRLGVVMTLEEFGTEAGTSLRPLQKRLTVETDPTVYKEIVRAIQAINGN